MKRYRILLILLAMISSMVLKGQGNTSYGSYAGNAGYYNSSFGYYAGDVVTRIYDNFIGCYAGKSTAYGGWNTFSGANAGKNNTTGEYNTYLGYYAGRSATTADENVAVGRVAGYYLSTGSQNVFLGSGSGFTSYAGAGNVFIGYASGYACNGSNNLFLGYYAGRYETGSNKLYIENSSSSSPLIYGEFNNDLVSFNGSLGIGSTEFDDAQLVVDGKILAKKIYITTDDFPDYVFSDNYPLLSLADLESYITANKHLPGIRTRDEVISDGVPLGELSIQLLEKIEELTLHIIRLNTKTDQIKNQNIQIQQEIEVIRGIDSNN